MSDFVRLKSDLTFDILRNAIYHTARRSFLDRVNRFLMFLVIVSGTAAAAQLGQHFGFGDWALSALAALFATLLLVGDFGVSASLHGHLQKRCYELLSELEVVRDDDENAVLNLRAKLTTIYGDEPPQMRALDAVAYNAASDSLGRSTRVKLGLCQNWLRQLYSFNETSFPEIKANAS